MAVSISGIILSAGMAALFLVQSTAGKLIGGGAVGASLMDGLRRVVSTPKNLGDSMRQVDEQTRIRINRRKKNFWIAVMVLISAVAIVGFLALDISGAADPKRTRTLELWEALTAILTPLFVLGTIGIDLRLRALDR